MSRLCFRQPLSACFSVISALYFVTVALAQAQWSGQTYKTESFIAPELHALYYGGDLSPGYLVFGPIGNAPYSYGPVLMTDSGDLIWEGPSSRSGANNVKVQKLGGEDVLTFWTGFGAAAGGVSHGYGSVAILDQTYSTIHNVCMSALDIRTTPETNFTSLNLKPCYMDIHESWVTDKGTIIFTAVNVTQADLSSVGGQQDGWILDWLFFEADIQTEKVLFRYSSLDHLSKAPFTLSEIQSDLTNGYGESAAKPWDFSHINAVQPLPATVNNGQGYFFSSRHYWSLFAVSSNNTMLWRLSGLDGGDFTLDPDVFFSWQHDARIHSTSSDGSQLVITLFNNDNYPGDQLLNQTTGLFLNVNLTSMHVSLAQSLADGCNPLHTVAEGSLQVLSDDHRFMGYGLVPYAREYGPDGDLLYEANWGPTANGVAILPAEGSYRVFKQEWHGVPATAPKVFAEPASQTGLDLWMSWNGATEYTAWSVYAGNDSSNLGLIAEMPRTGFETALFSTEKYAFVQAHALGAAGGSVLAKTDIFKV